MVDEATYYGDSEKYTGTSGSSTNQWCVEDVYDFLAIVQGGTDTCHYKLVKDIDFNNHPTYKYGFINQAIMARSASYYHIYIDGDGHNICNIILKNYDSKTFMYVTRISNVNFVNVICLGCTGSGLLVGFIRGDCKNCNFGIYMSSSRTDMIFKGFVKEDCTFNIKGSTTDGINFYTETLTRCHINLDISTNNKYMITGKSTTEDFVLDNSYVTGKIKTSDAEPYLFCYATLVNSYVALEIDTNGSIIYPMNGLSVSSVSFVDVDLLPKLRQTAATNLYYLTTAQAQDPSYLQSIGFPVIPVT